MHAGSNELPAPEIESFWDKLKDNFQNPLIRILCLALAFTMILATLGYADWLEVRFTSICLSLLPNARLVMS